MPDLTGRLIAHPDGEEACVQTDMARMASQAREEAQWVKHLPEFRSQHPHKARVMAQAQHMMPVRLHERQDMEAGGPARLACTVVNKRPCFNKAGAEHSQLRVSSDPHKCTTEHKCFHIYT